MKKEENRKRRKKKYMDTDFSVRIETFDALEIGTAAALSEEGTKNVSSDCGSTDGKEKESNNCVIKYHRNIPNIYKMGLTVKSTYD
eukprot:10383240-Ditylum_brightwellii.AAC.1